jgi:5'-deoxynucleotidase YfbR-like HD superfamily hydrolase
MQSCSGKKMDLLAPDYEQLDLLDVARAMSRIPRYNGATTEPVFLSQHSLHVLMFAQAIDDDPDAQKLALVHDLHEVVLGDIITPVHKATIQLLQWNDCPLDPISELKDLHDEALFHWLRFEPSDEIFSVVKKADRMAGAWEVETYWDFADGVDWKYPEYPTVLPAAGPGFHDFPMGARAMSVETALKKKEWKYAPLMTPEYIAKTHRTMWFELMADHFPHLARTQWGGDRT